MTSASIENMDIKNIKVSELMIPAEKVAHVQLGNPIEHALLVLVQSGYSSVPVLDPSYRFCGTIGKTAILKSVLGIERFEMELLSQRKVEEVMRTDIPSLHKDTDFLTCMKTVINFAFACVVDENGSFEGILTRRAILKQVNKHMYLDKDA
ncbi:cyclic-di-AMP-binding protein CbpB [Saliterribacillus persicus]|uniref:CBS domain protein n=1 Tax=Saliterribacillus persicus TaxID=930114 RepID=A0A368XUU3_9BACI|nr:cyclic-di-AMP-binding protein CbpB [Saliterribacillus persicus]RCW71840.1 CBS domain protein [Saliterribacillus persicus]